MHEDIYEKVARERRAKMVTVRKVGRRYQLWAPGASAPFATKTTKSEAVGLAWTYARFKLKNDAMTETGSVIAEGFKL